MEIVQILNSSIIYFIGLALTIGLIYSKKYWKTPSGYILIYLGLVLIIEYSGAKFSNNHWMYNIQSFSELLTVSIIFYLSVKGNTSKNIIIALFGICMIILLADLLLITKSFNIYFSYSFGFISLAIPLMCFVYLFELAGTEKILNQNRVLLYWLSIGLMIYHLCNLPNTILINEIFKIGHYDILYTIQSLSSIAMYSFFIIGFIWSYRKCNI